MRSTAIIGVVLTFALAVFLIVAASLSWWGLSVDAEIRPLDVLTLAFAIIVAILLQYYIANKLTDLRAEKDLLIGDIRENLTILRQCRETLFERQQAGRLTAKDATLIKGLLRRLSNGLYECEQAIKNSECRRLSDRMDSIRDAYFVYKISSTGASFPSSGYTAEMISQQERASRALAEQLQKLVFDINKHH